MTSLRSEMNPQVRYRSQIERLQKNKCLHIESGQMAGCGVLLRIFRLMPYNLRREASFRKFAKSRLMQLIMARSHLESSAVQRYWSRLAYENWFLAIPSRWYSPRKNLTRCKKEGTEKYGKWRVIGQRRQPRDDGEFPSTIQRLTKHVSFYESINLTSILLDFWRSNSSKLAEI